MQALSHQTESTTEILPQQIHEITPSIKLKSYILTKFFPELHYFQDASKSGPTKD